MNRYNIEKLFELAKQDLCCNTSYPYRRGYFSGYLTNADIMEDVTGLSLYFHIPFCKSLCRFCEYTRFLADDVSLQNHYVDILERQVRRYLETHPVQLLYGLDIGGGTPTALTAANLERVLAMTKGVEIRTLMGGVTNEQPAFKHISSDIFTETHKMAERTFFVGIHQTLPAEDVILVAMILKDSLAGNSR